MTDVQAQIIIGLLAVITVLLLIIAVSTYVPGVLLKGQPQGPAAVVRLGGRARRPSPKRFSPDQPMPHPPAKTAHRHQ